MPRLIDRYVIRSVVTPFVMSLFVFTFMLILPFLIRAGRAVHLEGRAGLDGRHT